MDLQDKSQAAPYFERLKTLWKDCDILIVEGETSRSGMGNDLFAQAKSVSRIIGPSKNAYIYKDELLREIKKYADGKLILLMLGPTAK
ncbi:GT-D fold domain-containing protein, partial [Streptococcus pneumoniae]|nr:GT-D fold domain-containing protein [Streptococcus pneumoniae]